MSDSSNCASSLRGAAAVILALLELNRTGEPAPMEIRKAGEGAVRELLGLAANLNNHDREAAEVDPAVEKSSASDIATSS
jgi:hypothetical protein